MVCFSEREPLYFLEIYCYYLNSPKLCTEVILELIGFDDSDGSEPRAFLTIIRNHFQKLKLSELILYWELSHK